MRRRWLWLVLVGSLAVGAWLLPKTITLPGPGSDRSDGEVRPEVKDAWAIAKKLLDHYRPEGLDRFTDDAPGEFEPLVKAGVLTDEDGRAIDRGGFKSLTFRRSVAFSRRYEFTFYYVPGRHAANALAIELNHRGEPVRSDTGEQDVSADLAADRALMWETGAMDWVADPARRANRASTARAIPVASRVFNTVQLVGRTRAEVIDALGDPRTSTDSIYRSPYAFWPPPPGAMVYCFTNGAYGWQFNVVFGADGRVSRVERHWIH
ncbi:MAG TPA: hypothetical protein VKE74_24040 [Gemmataceae bacterium]|nr:hypothetical protein [Gemmataceae bacterium]